MKVILICLLAITAQAATFEFSETKTLTMFRAEMGNVGRYEECVALLTKILLEADEIASHIMNKDYHKVVPLAIKIGKDIYDDINCFKNGLAELKLNNLTSLFADPTECIIKHIRLAAEAIQNAVQAIQEKNWKEAGRNILIALAEIQQAQNCTK